MEKFTIHAGVFQQSFDKRDWHYHDYYELMMISEGTGQRIVGDQAERFQPGDLVFLGRNLPNLWISDPVAIDPGSDRCVESIFVRFKLPFVELAMMELPEFAFVRKAIDKSVRGCEIVGNTRNSIAALMMQVPYLDSFEQIINLLSILNLIGKSIDINYLSSEQYPYSLQMASVKRVRIVQEFLMKNLQTTVNLTELAQIASMQEASLCRLFKKETGHTITGYLNHLRIQLSAKMLMNQNLKVEEIAFECGFNTISYFNRQFKKATGLAPLAYRRKVAGEN
jgi:AraC-like DNA-binding protein